MLNSIEHLIDTLPEPIKNVINAMYENNYSWERDRNVYFALLDLHKWLDEPTYGESILKKMMKAFFIKEKFEVIKKIVHTHHAIMAVVEKWREDHLLYGKPQLESNKIPRGKPSKKHLEAEEIC